MWHSQPVNQWGLPMGEEPTFTSTHYLGHPWGIALYFCGGKLWIVEFYPKDGFRPEGWAPTDDEYLWRFTEGAVAHAHFARLRDCPEAIFLLEVL